MHCCMHACVFVATRECKPSRYVLNEQMDGSIQRGHGTKATELCAATANEVEGG